MRPLVALNKVLKASTKALEDLTCSKALKALNKSLKGLLETALKGLIRPSEAL